jgi:hypothetical protein
MRVYSVVGEPTRYHVESTSLQCAKCNKTFGRHDPRFKYLVIGDECPSCFEHLKGDEKCPTLDVRFHLVDLSEFRPIGRCTCEHFAFRLQAQLNKLSPSNLRAMTQGEANKLRCTHIMAARELALDTTVEAHEQHRHEKAGRQREGAGA